TGLEVLDGMQQIDERAPDTVDRPRHNDFKLSLAGIIEQPIEARAGPASLSAGYARVVVNRNHPPATALGDLAELYLLVLHRLLVRADAQIQDRPTHLRLHSSNAI